MDVTGIDIRSIGKFISTKAVGSNRREDLTYEYKYPDGTKEERAAVKRAYKFSSRRDENIYKKLKSDDIIYNADVDENVKIGEDFKIRLKMLNTSKEDRHVFVTITTKAAFYTGIVAKDLRKMHEKVSLSKGEEKTVVLVIKAEDYLKMPPDLNVKIFFNAHVQETGKAFATMETVEFVKPELEAHIPSSEIVKGQPFEMTLFFTNPLPVNLTKGVFHIETSRMTPRSLTKSLRNPVSPGEKASVTVALTPYRSGKRYVEASFQSDQLSGVRGEVEVFVK